MLLKEFIGNCDEFEEDDEKIESFLKNSILATTQGEDKTVGVQSMLNKGVERYGKEADMFINSFSNTEEWISVMSGLKPWMCAFADFLNRER